jgi:hypothetical protein
MNKEQKFFSKGIQIIHREFAPKLVIVDLNARSASSLEMAERFTGQVWIVLVGTIIMVHVRLHWISSTSRFSIFVTSNTVLAKPPFGRPCIVLFYLPFTDKDFQLRMWI